MEESANSECREEIGMFSVLSSYSGRKKVRTMETGREGSGAAIRDGIPGREDRSYEVIRILPRQLRDKLRYGIPDFGRLQELRFRVGEPLGAVYEGKNLWVNWSGSLSCGLDEPILVTREMIREMLEYISGYSLYAFEEEIRQGFITIPGGHRIGLAGKVAMEDGAVKTIRHISFLNIRLSHQVFGCAKKLLPFLYCNGRIENTLLISSPRFGKTTLLRDLIRLVSDGNAYGEGVNTGVVDERGELAACFQGIPQNDLGRRTDVLDGCLKAQGITMLLRSMAPSVIAVDELATAEDIRTMEFAMNSGCTFLATAHGGSLEEIRRKPLFCSMMEAGLFQRIGVLGMNRIGDEVRERKGDKFRGGNRDEDRNSEENRDRDGGRNRDENRVRNRGILIYDSSFQEMTEGYVWY